MTIQHVLQPGLGHLAILQTPAQEPEDLSSGAFHGATPEHQEVLGPVELDDAGAPQLKLVQGHSDMDQLSPAYVAAGQAIPAVDVAQQQRKSVAESCRAGKKQECCVMTSAI